MTISVGKPIKLSSDVREFLQDAINDATHCEGAEMHYEFVAQLNMLLSPIYISPGSDKPVAYIDPQALIDFANNRDTKEWVWATHDAGLVPLYAAPAQPNQAVNLRKHTVDEVMHMSGFCRQYAEGWCAGNDNAINEVRVAGLAIKGD